MAIMSPVSSPVHTDIRYRVLPIRGRLAGLLRWEVLDTRTPDWDCGNERAVVRTFEHEGTALGFAALLNAVEPDEEGRSSDDLDYDAAYEREDWHLDLATESVSDHYGSAQRSPLDPTLDYDLDYRSRELYESAVVAHHTGRGNGRGTRVDHDEESRMWGR